MASIKLIKKDIEYLIDQLLADCCLAAHFHSDSESGIINIMQQAVDLRNSLFERVNNPAEKHNPSLVKKHYAQIRRDLFANLDDMFKQLSDVCNK